MKKIASLILALILCASMLAASLQTAGLAAEPEPALTQTPTPTATGTPDSVNGIPFDDDLTGTE